MEITNAQEFEFIKELSRYEKENRHISICCSNFSAWYCCVVSCPNRLDGCRHQDTYLQEVEWKHKEYISPQYLNLKECKNYRLES